MSNLFSTILGGTLGAIGAGNVADAQTKANQATIAASKANQQTGLNALQGESAFQDITRNAAGGFDVSQPGATNAATARSLASFGDIGRTNKANALTDSQLKLPTVDSAQQLVDRDIGRRAGTFNKGITDIMSAQTRNFGGLNSSAQMPATIDALSRFSNENKYNREQDALNLFDKSRANDAANISAELGNTAPRAAAPVFSAGTPGTQAAQLVAQTPTPATVADLGSAAPFMAGQSVFTDLRNQAQTQENNKLLSQLLSRQLGNQQAGAT